jgi:hypothetical protein
VGHKKKHKNKAMKAEGVFTFIGTFLSQALGQIVGEAVDGLRKKKKEALQTAQAVAP